MSALGRKQTLGACCESNRLSDMTLTREKPNRLHSQRGLWPETESEPQDRSIHFYTCRACGQAVDTRKLGDVFHHEQPGHEQSQRTNS